MIMPKLAKKKPNAAKRAEIYLTKEIETKQKCEALTDEEMGEKIGRNARTYRNKVKDPETFKLGELRIVFRALKFSEEEAARWIRLVLE